MSRVTEHFRTKTVEGSLAPMESLAQILRERCREGEGGKGGDGEKISNRRRLG